MFGSWFLFEKTESIFRLGKKRDQKEDAPAVREAHPLLLFTDD
jgi:hypothetical protein